MIERHLVGRAGAFQCKAPAVRKLPGVQGRQAPQRPAPEGPGQQREQQIKARQHSHRPGDAAQAGKQVAAVKQHVGQRQVRGQVLPQPGRPALAAQGQQQRKQHRRIIAGQNAQGSAPPEALAAGEAAPGRPGPGIGQPQAERRQQDHAVHPDVPGAHSQLQRAGVDPGLLPDVEPAHHADRHRPEHIRPQRALRFLRRQQPAQHLGAAPAQKAHSPFLKICTVLPSAVRPVMSISGLPTITSS